MLLHCHLTFIASKKKSVNNTYPFVLLYIVCQISLAALKIFLFVCLPLNFSIYIVMFSENDFITLFGVCLAFWISGFIVFNKFGKDFIYLFLIFFSIALILNLQICIFYIFLYYPTCHGVSIHIFLPFYSLWFSLDSLYCCVLLPSSSILQCLVSCVINPNKCSFQYYIFQFQKSHLFIFPSFPPCLFLCFIKHIDIRDLRSSSANSIISVISEVDLNDYFLKCVMGYIFPLWKF